MKSMVRSAWRYGAEISTWEGNRVVATVEISEPDWEPAVQWTHFQAVRAGRASPGLWYGASEVEPIWDAASGRPFVSSVGVRVPGGSRSSPSIDGTKIPSRYFRADVEKAATRLVQEGTLEAGERFRYRVTARPGESRMRAVVATEDGISVDRLPQAQPVVDRSFDEAKRGARARDTDHSDASDLPVILPSSLLDEAVELAAAAGEIETGGLLVGALCRDGGGTGLFVEVRALLPARHSIGRADRVTFTPETWEDALAAITLRGNGECLVGWMHSHPDFCGSCSGEARDRCPLSVPFLSEHDRSLHRTVFVRPFDIAMLVSNHGPRGHECSLFGWRRGIIERRSFLTTGSAPDGALLALPVPMSPEHASGDAIVARQSSICGAEDAITSA
jgi:proteasome lid subunit RPN8/RPN11